ncbi:hypothetical protein [Geodermatophilus normandii]|uniref:Uncharacterized protein n=1 Tax=Geodermatophilus normandii TaxID=1137989 RepID=A0A6P0GFN0_9ACTN|nr:hypothetical protein [Geodermatophilus normandii]NEM06060.1 hypothetical protein [Geodermatophilus normandii]
MNDHPPEDLTAEATFLLRRPQLRAEVLASADFRAWREKLRTADVDETTYYVRGGDMLKDEDQIIVEWLRRTRPALLRDEEE